MTPWVPRRLTAAQLEERRMQAADLLRSGQYSQAELAPSCTSAARPSADGRPSSSGRGAAACAAGPTSAGRPGSPPPSGAGSSGYSNGGRSLAVRGQFFGRNVGEASGAEKSALKVSEVYRAPATVHITWADYRLPPPLPQEAHVWQIGIWHFAQPRWQQLLNDDERRRAATLADWEKRAHFVLGRAVLRRVLAGYLDMRAPDIDLCCNAHGKPGLATKQTSYSVQFNLSHSGEFVVLGVTGGPRVGVDVERVRHDVAVSRIADRFFAPSERNALRSFPEPTRTEAFFACWTRKEAYVKAIGDGLAHSLRNFAVPVDVPPASRPNWMTVRPENPRWPWSFWSFVPAPGYVGCVAVEGGAVSIKWWEYRGDTG